MKTAKPTGKYTTRPSSIREPHMNNRIQRQLPCGCDRSHTPGWDTACDRTCRRVREGSLAEQLAQKLDERFRVLTGGDRSALPRLMRALIDWSFELFLLLKGASSSRHMLTVFVPGADSPGGNSTVTIMPKIANVVVWMLAGLPRLPQS